MHNEDLLEKYTLLWTRFQFSSTVVNGIFAYLNRHWIRREIDEGKPNVYEVYNVRHSNLSNLFITLYF